mmetsp:Transcript_58565/g.181577  ORF Transcript_58565/g.181577 Transcript_58565/m.181577 type:complete len:239 (+) Transcript_58565:130-846(+)
MLRHRASPATPCWPLASALTAELQVTLSARRRCRPMSARRACTPRQPEPGPKAAIALLCVSTPGASSRPRISVRSSAAMSHCCPREQAATAALYVMTSGSGPACRMDRTSARALSTWASGACPQALTAALHATPSTSSSLLCNSPKRESDRSHSWPFSHALMQALYVMASGEACCCCISANSQRATSHRLPFSHALMTAFHTTTLGCKPYADCISLSSSKALCHWRLFSQALMVAPKR